MAERKNSVRNTHPDYDAMAVKWQRCRDAASGEDAIHAAGGKYLPKLAEEKDDDYRARRNRTPFFNATYRTISGLRGMVFRKAAEIDAPASITEYFDDIDMSGTPLQAFAQDIVGEALTVGRVGILTDYPQGESEGVTVAQATTMGLRPSLQKYIAESIINWKTERINNATVTSLIVLAEQASLPGGEFEHLTEPRYRVLDLFNGSYRQRVFRINARGDDEQVGADIFPLMNNAVMNYIPLVIISVDHTGVKVEDPPLIDLVDMNLKHYSVSADYEHGCHFSGLPTLFISGYRPDETASKIYIGGASANCLPDSQAKAYYAETSGNFEALRLNLEDKKSHMAVLGARMLESQKAGVEAAETIARRQNGESSMLSAMAQTVSDGIEQSLTWFSSWAGQEYEVEYDLNKDFTPAGMTAQDLTALVSAWQAGAISQAVLFDNLKRGEIISENTTFEDEQAAIGDAAPVLAAPVVPPAGQ